MNHCTRRPLFPSLFALALAACGSSDDPLYVDAGPRRDAPLAVDAPAAAVDAGAVDAAGRDARPGDARHADAAAADAPPAATPAELILNEVGANQDGLHDLVELRVVAGGSAAGWRLERDYPRDPVLLATLPDVVVEAGQLIVVHLEPQGTSALAETTAMAQHSSAANYDGAWDFLGVAEEIPYTNQVLALRAPSGTVTSAVPFYRPDLVDPDRQPRTFPAELQGIIDEGLWSPACTPAPCSYEGNLADVAVSWTGSGTSPTGASVARVAAGSNGKTRSDWQPVPSAAPLNSFGAPN